MTLNGRALRRVEALLARAEELKVSSYPIEHGGRFVDCGIKVDGGLGAGLDLARICLADLAEVSLIMGDLAGHACPHVQVATDHPISACLASQYAGWAISEGKYFAMGSGPMRAAHGKEEIYHVIGHRETPEAVVGVLETRKPPTPAIVSKIAIACRVPSSAVVLLAAPTASLAGSVQIVARSVETSLHKLHELKFDLHRICSAVGSAPLPPVARDDVGAIGRTNDAILYGANVILYVTGDDASIQEIGPRVPSSSSADHGAPFAEIFARYDHDFYKVDPSLFSPARVVFQNLKTGGTFAFGETLPEVLVRSFFES